MPRKESFVAGCLTVTALFLQLSLADLVPGAAISSNFADPTFALGPGGIFYAFSTQTGGINVQVASSPDFTQWSLHAGYDALPVVPGWAREPPDAGIWAPDVNQRPDGTWVMYFASTGTTHPQKHCIGAAVSPNVTGPYTPLQTTLVCDLPGGGNIDPNLFQDPVTGQNYLVYKTDGNAIGSGGACGNGANPIAPTPLHLQLMNSTDLVTPIGDPIYLFSNNQPEDGPNVERPCIVYQDSTYFVLYNAQCYADLSYHIAYVSCTVGVDTTSGIAGCDWKTLKQQQQTRADRTLLKSNDTVSGFTLYAPGSMDVGPDQQKVVFHGDINLDWFEPNRPTTLHRDRAMYAGQVEFSGSSLRMTQLF